MFDFQGILISLGVGLIVALIGTIVGFSIYDWWCAWRDRREVLNKLRQNCGV